MPWLTLTQAAAYCGRSVRTLRRDIHAAAHPLPAYKVRGQWRVEQGELDAWIRGFSTPPDEVRAIVADLLAGVPGSRRP